MIHRIIVLPHEIRLNEFAMPRAEHAPVKVSTGNMAADYRADELVKQ